MLNNVIIPFILGQLAKLTFHIIDKSDVVFILMILLCAYIYVVSPKKLIGYLSAAIGFSTHELFFWSIGRDLGLEYYPLVEGSIIPFSFITFLVLALFIHCILFISNWIIKRVRSYGIWQN